MHDAASGDVYEAVRLVAARIAPHATEAVTSQLYEHVEACASCLGPLAWQDLLVCPRVGLAFCGSCVVEWASTYASDASLLRRRATATWVCCPAFPRCNGGGWELAELSAHNAFRSAAGRDALRRLKATAARQWQTQQDDLMSAVNLRCPNTRCRELLDPAAEGCTAMQCASCGCVFCYACLERFANPDEAHAHVPAAHGGDGPWLPRHKVLAVQAELRVARLAASLRGIRDDVEWRVKDELVASLELEDLHVPTTLDKILLAADDCNEDDVEILSAPLPPLGHEDEGRRLLALAAAQNWEALRQLVGELTRAGRDVSWTARDDNERTVLQLVITFHPAPLGDLGLLLDAGAGIETPQEHGFRPLHLACWKRDVTMAAFLLDRGADIDGRIVSNGRTALMLVAEETFSDLDMLRFLVRRGANPRLKDTRGISALVLAGERGLPFINVLLDDAEVSVNEPQQNGWYPLHCAVTNGALDVVRALLDRGADVNARIAGCSRTPLMLACANDANTHSSLDIVLELIARGADPNAQDATGKSPLLYLMQYRESPVSWLRRLPLASFDFETRDLLNDTLLHQVVKRCAVTKHRLLVGVIVEDGGLDPNARGQLDWPPLHLAAFFRAREAVEALLANGASVSITIDVTGNSCLHCAAVGPDPAARGIDFVNNVTWHPANAAAVLLALLSADSDLATRRNVQGETPLLFALSDERARASQRRRLDRTFEPPASVVLCQRGVHAILGNASRAQATAAVVFDLFSGLTSLENDPRFSAAELASYRAAAHSTLIDVDVSAMQRVATLLRDAARFGVNVRVQCRGGNRAGVVTAAIDPFSGLVKVKLDGDDAPCDLHVGALDLASPTGVATRWWWASLVFVIKLAVIVLAAFMAGARYENRRHLAKLDTDASLLDPTTLHQQCQ